MFRPYISLTRKTICASLSNLVLSVTIKLVFGLHDCDIDFFHFSQSNKQEHHSIQDVLKCFIAVFVKRLVINTICFAFLTLMLSFWFIVSLMVYCCNA